MAYTLPALPYAFDALEPSIDARTMEIHHDKHHAAYVTNVNKALEGHADLAALPVEKLITDLEKVPEAIRTKNLKLRDSYAAMWQQILEGAQRNGELRNDASLTLARLFILGALNWTVEWYKPGGRSIDQVAHEFAGLITSGLR